MGFVNFSRKWGGVRTWTLDFGGALRARGHRVVAVVRPGTPFEAACRAAGFSVHALRPGAKFSPLAVLRTARVLRQEGVDVAVVNIGRDLSVGAVAARCLRIPVVHRVGLVEDYDGTLAERLRHRLLVDAILVPADWMRGALLAALPWLRAGEVHAIPNSKPLAPLRRAERAEGAPVVLGTASQLSASKGHTLLFQALEAQGRTDVRLRVAATGPLDGALRAEAAERGLGGRVEFAGFQADIRSFLRTLDAFVLPSLKEGFPNALLEAMAEGLPVVAFDLEGVKEMVGEAGLLVARGDAAALAAAVGRLIGDGDLRRELGAAARRRVEERYDLAANAGRLEELLRRVARA